jgi:hypothetical protein
MTDNSGRGKRREICYQAERGAGSERRPDNTSGAANKSGAGSDSAGGRDVQTGSVRSASSEKAAVCEKASGVVRCTGNVGAEDNSGYAYNRTSGRGGKWAIAVEWCEVRGMQASLQN